MIITTSDGKGRFGASNNKNGDIIVPCEYSEIQIQPNGIVVKNGHYCGCYSLSGEMIYSPESSTKISNIVFLTDNTFIFSIPSRNKVMVSTLDGHFIIPMNFEAILFFCGVNLQAIEFSANKHISEIFRVNLFFDTGASISPKLCVKSDNLWGVYDTIAEELVCKCTYSNVIQYKNGPITLYDAKGGSFQIS